MSRRQNLISSILSEPITRRELIKRGGVAAASVSFLPYLAACVGSSTSQTRTPKVRMALANAFTGFDPGLVVEIGSVAVVRHIFDPLVRYDDVTGAYTPWTIPQFPQSTSSTTYETTLNPGLTFHDGSPVTPSDVAFTFEYALNPKTGSLVGALITPIQKVTTQGDKIIFHVAQPFNAFPKIIAGILIMPEKIFNAKGAQGFATSPVGSGPFTFGPTTPGKTVQLNRYKNYGGKYKVKLDQITFDYIVSDSTREVELLGGELDLIDQVPYLDYPTLSKNSSVKTGDRRSDLYVLIELNRNKKPFNDVRVRQALLYGMDRNAIIENAFGHDRGLIADSILPPDHPFYVKPQTTYPYDPNMAKSLLAEAGYPNGFNFELLTSTIPSISQVGTLLQSQLAKIGINATIKLTETEAGFSIVGSGSYDAYLAYSVPEAFGSDADVSYRIFDYGAGRDGFYGNYGAIGKKYDQYVDQGLLAGTEQGRIQAYAQAQEVMSSDVFNAFPLIWMDELGAWAPYISGYVPPAGAVPDLTNVSVG